MFWAKQRQLTMPSQAKRYARLTHNQAVSRLPPIQVFAVLRAHQHVGHNNCTASRKMRHLSPMLDNLELDRCQFHHARSPRHRAYRRAKPCH